VVLLVSFIVILLGPTKIFYLAHEVVFPDKHQWFFYYEESLMSTMMKAPALFGPIALQLLILTILCWFAFLYCIKLIPSTRNSGINKPVIKKKSLKNT
jgi:hypothetical protein